MSIDWRALRVLVVDDQIFILNLVSQILREVGIAPQNIGRAENGDDAIKLLGAEPVALAICDINMRPGNGLHLLKRIRTGRSPAPRDLPVIFLTGHADQATVSVAVQLDVNGLVVKPVARNDLVNKIERVLANKRPLPKNKDYESISVELSSAVKASMALDGKMTAKAQGKPPPPTSSSDVGSVFTLRMRAEQIRAGDTVCENVLAPDGSVVIQAGTRLSAESARTLAQHMAHYEIADVAVSPGPPS
ncbi:MAG: response regulator [Alphaproteobacteria bacterium]|nr:response regulator [Alphaproteobacteria bacterium]